MASAFGHAFAGVMLGKTAFERKLPARFWVLAIVCSILPDADAIGHMLGVPYSSMWGHRGITHSILFAALVGVLVPLLFFRDIKTSDPLWRKFVLFFFIVTLSHSLLDGLTSGGLGAAYFAPFDNTRHFLPWRPIRVSPIGVSSFFSEWGIRVLVSEAVWIGIPCILMWIVSKIARRAKRS